jgi:hypothetical protein
MLAYPQRSFPEMLVALLLMHELPCGSPRINVVENELRAKGVDF